jgi:hypothetical protein
VANQQKISKGKSRRQAKTNKRGKMKPENKTVCGPLENLNHRMRGNKCGRGRVYLPRGHVARTHDLVTRGRFN